MDYGPYPVPQLVAVLLLAVTPAYCGLVLTAATSRAPIWVRRVYIIGLFPLAFAWGGLLATPEVSSYTWELVVPLTVAYIIGGAWIFIQPRLEP